MPASKTPPSPFENPFLDPSGEPDEKVSKRYSAAKNELDGLNPLITGLEVQLANPWYVETFGPIAVGLAIKKLEDAKNNQEGALTELKKHLAWAGKPSALRSVANEWSQVGHEISKCRSFFTLNQMHVDDWWSSKAADAYVNSLTPQADYLKAVSQKAFDMRDALNDTAKSIDRFWMNVQTRITKFMADVIEKIAGLNPLQTVQTIVGCGTEVVKMIKELWNLVKTQIEALQNQATKLKTTHEDMVNFPDGHWKGPGREFERPKWKTVPEEE